MEGDNGVPQHGHGVIISIHTLRMEGDFDRIALRAEAAAISIHTLRMEGDSFRIPGSYSWSKFHSTPSAWRVTL